MKHQETRDLALRRQEIAPSLPKIAHSEGIALSPRRVHSGQTQQEIAEKFTLDRSTVAKVLDDVKKRKIAEIHTPDSLQFYNVWHFANCDRRYGVGDV